jgi:predicted nucleic acid-binding protein
MQRIYLDANILLEILFKRARHPQVEKLLSSMENVQFCASVLSIDLVMYFVELDKKPKDVARQFLRKYTILNMTPKDTDWAYDNDTGDFEDALQVACARRHGCASFITLDQKLERMYGTFMSVHTIR